MKRKLIILIIFSSMILLSGCTLLQGKYDSNNTTLETETGNINDSTDNNEDTDKTYLGYASDFEYSIIQGDIEKSVHYFYANFSDITYKPIKNEICFNVKITDGNYIGATYYIVLRKKGVLFPIAQSSFSISNSITTHKTCFDSMKNDKNYEIIIGKINRGEYYFNNVIDAVASFEFRLPSYYERGRLSSYVITQNNKPDIINDESPSISFNVHIKDPEKVLNKIIINVYYPLFNDLIMTKEIVVDDNYFDGENITIDNIEVNNLSPNVDYLAVVFGSGNDGVDDFDNVQITLANLKTNTYNSNICDSYHGLYGVITGHHIEETTTVIDYILENTGYIISSSDKKPLKTFLNIYTDNGGNLVHSYPLDESMKSIEIDNQYLKNGSYLLIETDRGGIVLSSYFVWYDLPEITDFKINGNELRFNFTSSSLEILSVDIEFSARYDEKPFQVFSDVKLIYGENTLIMNRDLSNLNTLYSSYTITFIGLNGKEEITLYRSEMINYN